VVDPDIDMAWGYPPLNRPGGKRMGWLSKKIKLFLIVLFFERKGENPKLGFVRNHSLKQGTIRKTSAGGKKSSLPKRETRARSWEKDSGRGVIEHEQLKTSQERGWGKRDCLSHRKKKKGY